MRISYAGGMGPTTKHSLHATLPAELDVVVSLDHADEVHETAVRYPVSSAGMRACCGTTLSRRRACCIRRAMLPGACHKMTSQLLESERGGLWGLKTGWKNRLDSRVNITEPHETSSASGVGMKPWDAQD
jgi:hypothetical protein